MHALPPPLPPLPAPHSPTYSVRGIIERYASRWCPPTDPAAPPLQLVLYGLGQHGQQHVWTSAVKKTFKVRPVCAWHAGCTGAPLPAGPPAPRVPQPGPQLQALPVWVDRQLLEQRGLRANA